MKALFLFAAALLFSAGLFAHPFGRMALRHDIRERNMYIHEGRFRDAHCMLREVRYDRHVIRAERFHRRGEFVRCR